MRPAKNCVVVAAVCLVAACSISSPRASTRGASYQATPCPQPNIAGVPDLDFPPGVQCGYLTVPENRAKPDGRKIRIFVMRAPAVSATPKPDPLVYLSGGPGGAGSFEVAFDDQAGSQRRPRGHLRRPARHAPRRPPPRMSRSADAVHQRRHQRSLRGGIDHRRGRRGDPEVPGPVGRHRRRPRCLQHRRERRRHRRPAGGAGHRHLERLRGLLRIEARVDRAARSPAGHPQRGPRFGVAPHEQHRRELVVGPGQLVQGDLRCMCGPAVLRHRLPEPGERTSPPR